MDSSLPQSKSVPSNLTAGRRRVSISGSGSYQSHLSSLGHLHRAHGTSERVSLSFAFQTKDYLHVLEEGLTEERSRVGGLSVLKQSLADPATFLLEDIQRILGGHVWRLRTLITLYCCLSVVFSSLKVYTLLLRVPQAAQLQLAKSESLIPTLIHEADDHRMASAPLMDISLPQRLSVSFRGLGPQAHLETFVVQARRHSNSDLTACLWIEDTRVEEALPSSAKWSGPVSLLVVTTHTPNSTEYKHLLEHFPAMHASNANVHVLYVPSIASGSSNAYLNMARFFARTPRVILFPDGIPKAAATRSRWLDKLPTTRHPILLSNTSHKGYSPRPLAPVVLPRDHPVWCTERLYMFGSRMLDWEDCLWALWLESAGEASSVVAPRFWEAKNASHISVPPFAMKMRLRWSVRYRSEACTLALKRAHASSKMEKRHMQWRRKFCRETVGPGVVE